MLKHFSLLLLLAAFSLAAQAQELSTKNKKAVELYMKAGKLAQARQFGKAIEEYKAAVKKDPGFGEAYLRIADLERQMGNVAARYEYLGKGLSVLPYSPTFVNDYYAYADMSLYIGDYGKAREYFEKFLQANPKQGRQIEHARLQLQNVAFAEKAIQNPVPFKPVRMPDQVNQFKYQYFPAVTADQRHFVYTARRGAGAEHDENLYVCVKQKDTWSQPYSISPLINTKFNEGAASISGDGKTLVFSSCNRPDSEGDCDLYVSYRSGNEWSKPVNLGKNVNTGYWDSQPTLSADGRTLYFSSNRRGGLGGEDIWYTTKQDDGTWSPVKNVGAPINTPGREMSPFIHASGTTLYFASDGHIGMGGMDMFKVSLEKKGWGEPENLGYPLNTYEDEAALFITTDNTRGFYSRHITSETAGKSIDIYEFEVPQQWKSRETSTYAQGTVYDAVTRKPLGAYVQLYDITTDELSQQVNSDKVNGDYTIVLNEGRQYAMYVSAEGYLLKSLNFDYTARKDFDPLVLDVYLDPARSGASIVLNNLFFDTGKYNLEQKSKTELNKLITFMQQNPKIKVEISGHTDDVGSDKDNQQLSEKRAKSVFDYLTANGVARDKVRYAGYGESKPVKPNTSEENRQQNRRIELKIL